MWRGHRQMWGIPVPIQVPEHGPPRVIQSVIPPILVERRKMVLLHGPNPNLSVLIPRKQLPQLINKMRILSNRMEMVMAIQESDLSAILRLSRPPEVVHYPVTPTNRLYIGYPEKPRHSHPAELRHSIKFLGQQP